MVEGKVTEVTSPRAWGKSSVFCFVVHWRGFNRLRKNRGFGWRSAFSAAIRSYFNEGFSPGVLKLFLGVFAPIVHGGLASVRADVHLLEVSIELTLQGLLVFLTSGAMAGGPNVECD
jgi:hypothetical protein